MHRFVRKRTGELESFQPRKIEHAIQKAAIAMGISKDEAKRIAKTITRDISKQLQKEFFDREKIPSIEQIQDRVIALLKKKKYIRLANEYSAYRKKKAELRKIKQELGLPLEPKLTVNALEVLKARYLLKDETGKIIETPKQLFMRVATTVAKADKRYGKNPRETEKTFFLMMTKLEFLPNSPTLFNAGTPMGQLSACFVLPIEDSLESIFTTLKHMALIEQTGGGVGFTFTKLRPRGDIVKSTKGVASGPVSFMRVYNIATEVIKAGGKRRGAMMGILRVDHPDIVEFITAKGIPGILDNFNISVAVSDEFMSAVKRNADYKLINPRTGKPVRKLNARKIWHLITENAWRTGDPGAIFIDEINRHNPTPSIGRIESTNPCSEQPLLPYESCNLGSINLTKFVSNGKIDWEKLRITVRNAVHFLDNVIDVNKFPLKQIKEKTLANRKIGLGIMGWAEMLIMLGIKYDSQKALQLAEKLMRFISTTAREKSIELAEERGSFPNFDKSIWADRYKALRNATCTTIAPTGSISIIAGCSSGIEPLFAISFMREVLGGKRLFEVSPLFERIAKERGFYSADLLDKIAKTGSLQNIAKIPRDVKQLFRTAFDITPEWHVRIQAAFQRYTDNAVSKTINLPTKATIDDVQKAYELAYKLKCKGITVYRYGSKPKQVLYFAKPPKEKYVIAKAEYAGGCPGVCPH